ncbi:MAG TPA: DUF2637 domain-containing protein [Streptosporangiaceae bacterium]|nr:DUF2637 domain-containing protein [Streptosporangiaceae bacterium]
MSDTRPGPRAAYPAPATEEAAYAADGWSQEVGRQALAKPGRDAGRVLRILALIAVAVGLAALTAAACLLSYSSVHHLAIQAGVHGRLASVYPLIFDAILVVAGCSVLALRGAGLVSRLYSWLCMLVLLAALAAGGALRAEAVKIPHKVAALVAAIVPWALVLIGFGLLVALLRYARLRRLGKRNGQQRLAADNRPPEVARSMVGAPIIPVAEGERDEMASHRPLIPGLPPRPHANTAPEPPPAEQAADVNATQTAAAAAGGTGTEPPTVPNPAAVPAPASLASAVQATGQDQARVRRAEMQLRARTPRPSSQDAAEGGQATQGWQTPFIPKVAQQGAPASQDHGSLKDAGPQQDVAFQDDYAEQDDSAQAEDGVGSAGGESSAEQPKTEDTAGADALPKRVPGQQPAISGFDSKPANPAASQEPPTEPTSSASEDDTDETTFNAAPTVTDDDDADGLPALRRTRSSPTPPKEA